VKSGPCGWTTFSERRGDRFTAALPDSFFATGRIPVSVTLTTFIRFMSTVTTTPSIGRSYGFGCTFGFFAVDATLRRRSTPAGTACPAWRPSR
jgi:hypothetical protein